jgi:DNA repair exonuclease SbcCD ATPase subunit
MAEQTGLLSRIAGLFGRRNRLSTYDETALPGDDGAATQQLIDPSRTPGSIFRPWAKRDQALQNLSQGFVTLTQLMSAIKESLEKQQSRQDELMNLLGRLPSVIEAIPESNRTQAEALRTIYDQLAKQNNAQSTLGEVLNRIVDAGGEQRKLIDQLNDQLDGLRQTDASISDNLVSVGSAMQVLGQNSHASASVLQQLQEGLRQRDEEMTEQLRRQNQRFNFILWLSAALSITVILSLVMLTYLALRP